MGCYLFNGSSDFMVADVTPLPNTPSTIMAWIKPSALTALMTVLHVTDISGGGTNANEGNMIDADGATANDPGVARVIPTSNTENSSTLASVLDTTDWHCLVGTFYSPGSEDRQVHIDGTAGVAGTLNRSVTGPMDRVRIGSRGLTPSNFFNGRIAEVALWDVQLSGANISLLAAGDRAADVDPTNLVRYWTLRNAGAGLVCEITAASLTVSGATFDSEEPPVAGGSEPAVGNRMRRFL